MMRVRFYASGLALAAAIAGMHPAQAAPDQVTEGQPLSVIDWLGSTPSGVGTVQRAPVTKPVPPARGTEPAVTKSATVPQVTVAPLGAGAPLPVGLVPPSVTGLPRDLWAGSTPDQIEKLLLDLPEPGLPAAQALLFSLLLTEADAPIGGATAQDQLTLARVDRLVALGSLDPALSLITQVGVTGNAEALTRLMDISLLTGSEDAACTTLARAPRIKVGYDARIFCAGRSGRWEDAALLLDSARALGLVAPDTADLLDHFLNPESFEDSAGVSPPRPMTPLAFRLLETIGEAQPTGSLPRAYAVADLRDVAGWKSQLEAAERLTRAGALPDNQLLGLYTDRQPSASGGVWDRVSALQRFETALATGNLTAIAKSLPRAWRAMQEAQLEPAFAALFADALSGLDLEGRARRIAQTSQLLSAGYEAAATDALPNATFLRAVAMGDTATLPVPATGREQAIARAFSQPDVPAGIISRVKSGQLGNAILQALTLLDAGARGDDSALGTALASLRALGLEDIARRAALQVMLLERQPT